MHQIDVTRCKLQFYYMKGYKHAFSNFHCLLESANKGIKVKVQAKLNSSMRIMNNTIPKSCTHVPILDAILYMTLNLMRKF